MKIGNKYQLFERAQAEQNRGSKLSSEINFESAFECRPMNLYQSLLAVKEKLQQHY